VHNKIKNKIEKELSSFIRSLDKTYPIGKVSPVLFRSIKEFVGRKGKRARPCLFVIGYLGFARETPPNLYKAAISFELLHDFLLVHDDIIDKSSTRRGKPVMHKVFDGYLKRFRAVKFNGQDLAIIAGDVMYAMAVDTFLSIKEEMQRKVKGLREFLKAALSTGIGEFIELLGAIKDIGTFSKEDIYRIYDYKTARYSFASALSCGAILAGAAPCQINRLYKYGIYLGRAFQIKDDILGIFGDEKKTGKSPLTDLQEAKKTLLIWYAYKNSQRQNRSIIKRIFAKNKVNKGDLLKMRRILTSSGALDYAEKEISHLVKKAEITIKPCAMFPEYKASLQAYSRQLLSL